LILNHPAARGCGPAQQCLAFFAPRSRIGFGFPARAGNSDYHELENLIFNQRAYREIPFRLYLLAFGAVMLTSKEYLQQAEECLQLATASSDVYVKEALTELASDFKAMAKDLEKRNERWRETDHGLDGKCDGTKIIAGWREMDEWLCSPLTSQAF
jgi:hypothetical protein